MKDFRAVKTELACYAVIIFAAFLMGFAIKNLYDPVNLVTGGVSGVAIIFKSLFDIPLWLTNTLLNIPLFLAAWRLKDIYSNCVLVSFFVCFAGNDHCRR